MNCSEFQQRLEEAVENHGPTAAERVALVEHLEGCSEQECRQVWQQAEAVAQAVRCWREDVVQVDLSESVLGRLRSEQAARLAREEVPTLEPRYALVRDPAPAAGTAATSSSPGRIGISVATLAAGLLLVLSVLTLSGPAHRETASTGNFPRHSVAAVDQLPQRDRPSHEVAGVPQRAGGRLAGSYASMPLSATQFLTDAVVLVVPGDLTDPEEEPSPADAWAERLEKRWEPIGRELNRSLEVLMEAVPRSESAS